MWVNPWHLSWRKAVPLRKMVRTCRTRFRTPAALSPTRATAWKRVSPKARLDCPDNLVAQWTVAYGDIDGAFASAAHRFTDHFRMHKGGGHSIEARGVVGASSRARSHRLGFHPDAAQGQARLVQLLGLPEHQVAVIAPMSAAASDRRIHST